ncbi:MAG: hypothetical protein IKO49_04940 [Bacilli bacterium]|nr:hypothetical protein [Bacilli bacterium]
MKYEEFFEKVKTTFKNSIHTQDEELKNKIYLTLLKWYGDNFESELKKAFETNNETKVLLIADKISKICDLDDLNKLKSTYKDESLIELNKISSEIFEKVINYKTDIVFTEEEYNNYKNKIGMLKKQISPIFNSEIEYISSECELDLNYLLNKGNVECLSVRSSAYINNRN